MHTPTLHADMCICAGDVLGCTRLRLLMHVCLGRWCVARQSQFELLAHPVKGRVDYLHDCMPLVCSENSYK